MIIEITADQSPQKIIVTAPPSVGVNITTNAPQKVVVEVFRDGKDGEDGEPGLSAYELAQLNGFPGTEAEWLETLKGKTAYQIAVELGFPGTEPEWIASLTANCVWGSITGILTEQADLMAKFDEKLNTALVGAANGVTPLDAGAKIATAYFPDEILGNVKFRGTYNGVVCSSSSVTYNGLPLPNAATQNAGIYFIVTAPFDNGGTNYSIGDWILSLGNAGWSKVDNSDSVSSVFGRVGNIIANQADYQAFYPLLSTVYNNPVWIGSLAASKVGLANVDNTSDINKPVSTAQLAAINAKVQNSLAPSATIAPSADAIISALSNKIAKDVGATYTINAIKVMTAAEYSAAVKDANTLYAVV